MTTKTLNEYMNDPDIKNESMPLREVHAIRLMIWDETKDMSLEERKSYHRKTRERFQKQYGFKVVSNTRG